MQERIANAQLHDPNMVRLPDGSWGKIQQTSTGYKIIEAAETPVSSVDSILESAVSEVTQEELKVTTLALLRKVSFIPSTLMGHAYVTSTRHVCVSHSGGPCSDCHCQLPQPTAAARHH